MGSSNEPRRDSGGLHKITATGSGSGRWGGHNGERLFTGYFQL